MKKNNDKINKIKVSPNISIKQALKKIDEVGLRILFVCEDNGSLIGSLSDGDIRRRILKTGDLQEKIDGCYKRHPVCVIDNNFTMEDVKRIMLKKTIEVLPVVDDSGNIIDILFWKEVFGTTNTSFKKINIPVVIMAGGKGERLGPFTKILPKPLVPIGETPIIERIMDKFYKNGAKHFYITLNYKGEMVKTYFENAKKDYVIDYVWEKDFLGTAGSLTLLPPDLADVFMVSNCDIIVDVDYADLLKFHEKNKNTLTVVGSIQHHRIPYGIVHFEREGRIQEIQEKPELDFTINTGLYVLSRKALSYIRKNKRLDMTDLIQILLNNKENVGVYPVSQKSYVDIGQLEEYKAYIEKLI